MKRVHSNTWWRRKVVRRSMAAVLMLSPVFAACGGSAIPTASVPGAISLTGTWTLTTVGGKSPPYTFQASDPRLELMSATYLFSADGSYKYTTTVRSTDLDGTVVTAQHTETGVSVVTADYVTIGASITATVAGNSMTIVSGGVTEIFTKQ